MALTRGTGNTGGIFASIADLQLAEMDVDQRAELSDGARYVISATDDGNGILLANGNYANPIGLANIRYGMLAKPTFDLFAPNKVGVSMAGAFTNVRSTVASYTDVYDELQEAAANDLRPETDGYRFEGIGENFFLNSLVGVTQAITIVNGEVYTLSINEGAGSITITGGGTGVATLGNNVTFTATSTTATFTVSGQADKVNVENLPLATSFIETAGAPATRAADANSTPYSLNMPRGDQAFTIRFKGVIDGYTNNNRLFGSDSSSSTNRIYLRLSSGRALSFTNGSDVNKAATPPITFREVFDYFITSDGTTYKSYLNGVLEGSASVTTPALLLPSEVRILRGSSGANNSYGNCSIFKTWIGVTHTADEVAFQAGV
jgi:hypothetical protein